MFFAYNNGLTVEDVNITIINTGLTQYSGVTDSDGYLQLQPLIYTVELDDNDLDGLGFNTKTTSYILDSFIPSAITRGPDTLIIFPTSSMVAS